MLNDFGNSVRPPSIARNEDGFAAFYNDSVADINIANDDENTTNNANNNHVTFNGMDIIIPNQNNFGENQNKPIEPAINTIDRHDSAAPVITNDNRFSRFDKY